jgi:hypothetical protein
MGTTIGNIVQDAMGILGEVTGVGTQLYSEPRMIKDAGRAFNMLFKKHWWPVYTYWMDCALNGTDGTILPPETFVSVIDFDDFLAVHRDKQSRALPKMQPTTNPLTLSGTTPQFWGSMNSGEVDFASKKIRIFPVTSTGRIQVRARHHPLPPNEEWNVDVPIALDRDLIVFGTAYVALSGDDLNPQAKADVQAMMDSRYRDIMNSISNQRIALSERATIPGNWFVNPY